MVALNAFTDFLQKLNLKGRRQVTLLKERDLNLTDKALQLLREVKDNETLFLHRKPIRKAEE